MDEESKRENIWTARMSEPVMADKPTGEFRSRRVHQKTFGVKKST